MALPLFLAPLALKLSPVGRFLKAIPRSVWIALAIALVLFLGWRWHVGAVKDARKEGHTAGVAYEGKRIADKASALKVKADRLAADIRRKNDAQNRAIAGAADDLRLRGPGKAACPGTITSRPGGRVAPGGSVTAPLDQVPDRTGVDLIAVPFADLVGAGERCDLNRGEVLAWREWHRKLSVMK